MDYSYNRILPSNKEKTTHAICCQHNVQQRAYSVAPSHEVQAQKDNSMAIGVGKGWAGELAGVLEICCYLDVNGCYTDLYTCKNSSCHTFKVCAFIVCQLSLNAKVNF